MVRKLVASGVVPGILSGMVSGVLSIGIGSLIGMWAISASVGLETELGFDGPLRVLLFGAAFGSLGGLIFQIGVGTGRMPRLFATRGATFGLLLFIVLIPFVPANSFHDADSVSLAISVFGLVFVGYGFLLDLLLNEFKGSARSEQENSCRASYKEVQFIQQYLREE
ncbi:MAG: hypothetical protein HY961_01245 [Ignavibacteriae bacterium]|nr:hypothetical protein [Ignavibacteriota bacterium]